MTTHKIIHGTCMDMKEVEDDSVDLVFTSPPYFNVKDYSKSEGCIGEEDDYNKYMYMMRKVFKNCYDKLKDGRYLIINIAEVISKGTRFPIPWHYFTICESIGFKPRGNIIWKKPDGITLSKRFGVLMQNPYATYYYPNNVYEFNMLFTKGKVTHVEKKDMYKINIDKAKPFQTDVWTIQPDTNNPHPAPFPYKLAKNMIYLYCPKEGTVLEPFSGSGTTIMAARDMGMSSLGYEINEDYFKYIKHRVGFESGMKEDGYVRDFAGNRYYVIEQKKKEIEPYNPKYNYIYDASGNRQVIKKVSKTSFKSITNSITPLIKENKYVTKKCLMCNRYFVINYKGNIYNYRKEEEQPYVQRCPYCDDKIIVDKKEFLEHLEEEYQTQRGYYDDNPLFEKVQKKETFNLELDDDHTDNTNEQWIQ